MKRVIASTGGTLATLVVPFVTASFLFECGVLSSTKAAGLAVFVSTVLLWITEALPLPANALLVPCLATVSGALDTTEAFGTFSDPIIFLFIGVFLLAQAMSKHQWDKRMAFFLLRSPRVTHSLFRLSLLICSMSFILSMWVSNTATVALLTPIVTGIVGTLRSNLPAQEHSIPLAPFLLLGVAYSASIGGVATPVGTPPNLITLGLLRTRGIHISFAHWLTFALPIALTMFSLLILLLRKRYPMPVISDDVMASLRKRFQSEFQSLGRVTRGEITIGLCFGAMLILWLLPDLLVLINVAGTFEQALRNHLPMSVVAILAAIALFILPKDGAEGERVLTWAEAKLIDWGTIILFGGGLALGRVLENTGLGEDLGGIVFGWIPSEMTTLALASLAALIFSEVASNTASAAIFVGILLGTIPESAQMQEYGIVFSVCIATSYGFMLPVATPPNAIVFGTQMVPMREMMKTGTILNLMGWLVNLTMLGVLRLHTLFQDWK